MIQNNVNSAEVAEKIGMRFEKEVIVWERLHCIYALH